MQRHLQNCGTKFDPRAIASHLRKFAQRRISDILYFSKMGILIKKVVGNPGLNPIALEATNPFLSITVEIPIFNFI